MGLGDLVRGVAALALLADAAAAQGPPEGTAREPARVSADELLGELRSAPRDNEARVHRLLTLYERAGAPPERIRLQDVAASGRRAGAEDAPALHNILVTKEGATDSVIVVGGHLDRAEPGDGVIDDWSGACLAQNLYQALRGVETRHTFVFVGFAHEERGLNGSRRYVASLTAAERAKIDAMVCLECLGVADPYVVTDDVLGDRASSPHLIDLARRVAQDHELPLGVHGGGGTSDYAPFRAAGIPVLSLDGLPTEKAKLIHSADDTFANIRPECYVNAFRLATRLLLALDREPSRTVRPPVAAEVRTTLETAGAHIRQYAFDGDPATAFVSARQAGADDHLTLLLDRPVAVKSIRVSTGRADAGDRLDAGILEISEDGEMFAELGRFADGVAGAAPGGRVARAIRIRPTADLGHPLAIREVAIDSDPTVAPFRYPVEFAVDATAAPEMRDWALDAARACERAYPTITEELQAKGFGPPTRVVIVMTDDPAPAFPGALAFADDDRITARIKYFKDHPKATGVIVHEAVHVVQRCRRGGNPHWLVEGVAEYVNLYKCAPERPSPIDPDGARYDRGYGTSAAFLAYLVETYDLHAVRKLSRAMRNGLYTDEIFLDLTGKPLAELGKEWRAALRRSSGAPSGRAASPRAGGGPAPGSTSPTAATFPAG